MKKVSLNITDQRMLQLPEILKQDQGIRFTQEFCDAIGFLKQNIRNVKLGTQHFQGEHIRLACESFNVNANWIAGLEPNVYRKKVKEAVKEKASKPPKSGKLKKRKSIPAKVFKIS